VTLEQANLIAQWADRLEEEGEVDSPWAVAIGQFKKSHHVEDGHWVRNEAEGAQMGEVIELAGFSPQGRIVTLQIMRPGTFQDMHGKMVAITAQDLRDYVANFEAGAAGQELPVFLGHPPPEIRAGEPAAAWYKRLYLQTVEGEERLFADLELSDIGQENLEAKRYKYFSPTIDLAAKVIRGGGFVNLPAIKGLPAIELSQFLREVSMADFSQLIQRMRSFFGLAEFAVKSEDGNEYPARCYLSVPDADQPSTWGLRICEYVGGEPQVTVPQLGRAAAALGPGFRGQRYEPKEGESIEGLKRKLVAAYRRAGVEQDDIPEYLLSEGGQDMTDEERAELEAKIREDMEAELAQRQQEEAELAERIRKELQPQIETELVERARKQAELAVFVGSVTTGDHALSTPPAELTTFLAGLTPEQLEAAKAILQAKVVDLSERGHTGAGAQLKPLPTEMLAALKQFVRGRADVAKAVATFCEANLLKQEEFDFSEFLPKE